MIWLLSKAFFYWLAILCVPQARPLSVHGDNRQCPNDSNGRVTFSRACSRSGESDVLILLPGLGSGPILIDHHDQHQGAALVNEDPWSSEPPCTGVLKGLEAELCVYTNVRFSAGRGLSIFTTPQIWLEFTSLPIIQDSYVLATANKPDGAYHTRHLPGKGVGMLANGKLERGDVITAFTPVLLVYMEDVLSTPKREQFLRLAVDQLPPKTRDAYLNLATIYGDKATIIQDVLKANTFEVQIGGARHLAIFPETSRINHDCAPNSQYYLDPETMVHTVRAARKIAPDEEITIAYASPFEPHAVRQENLRNTFHFTCSCTRCRDGFRSDKRLEKIAHVQKVLSDWSPDALIVASLNLTHYLNLYQMEGLHAFMDTAYGYAALTCSSVGAIDGARKFAKLAAEVVEMKDGRVARDYAMWQEMIRDPRGHWSWDRRTAAREQPFSDNWINELGCGISKKNEIFS